MDVWGERRKIRGPLLINNQKMDVTNTGEAEREIVLDFDTNPDKEEQSPEEKQKTEEKEK